MSRFMILCSISRISREVASHIKWQPSWERGVPIKRDSKCKRPVVRLWWAYSKKRLNNATEWERGWEMKLKRLEQRKQITRALLTNVSAWLWMWWETAGEIKGKEWQDFSQHLGMISETVGLRTDGRWSVKHIEAAVTNNPHRKLQVTWSWAEAVGMMKSSWIPFLLEGSADRISYRLVMYRVGQRGVTDYSVCGLRKWKDRVGTQGRLQKEQERQG